MLKDKNHKSPKRISVWGSTGSIGTQTLDVVRRFPGEFEIAVLTAHSNIPLLLEEQKLLNKYGIYPKEKYLMGFYFHK